MSKGYLKGFIVLTVFLFLAIAARSQTESITLTTYYPSPHGAYMSLEVNDLIVNNSLTVNGITEFNDNVTFNGEVVGDMNLTGDISIDSNSHGSCTLKTLTSGDYSLECPDGYYAVALHYESPTWSNEPDNHSHPEIYRIKCCKL